MNNEKSLGAVLLETRDELKEFVLTRVAMLQAEVREKVATFKHTVPLLLIALGLLLAGWITLTFAAVAALHAWLAPNAYAWAWAALIVAGVYIVSGIAVGLFAYSAIKQAGLAPKRTLSVLKQDQAWIQKEARAA